MIGQLFQGERQPAKVAQDLKHAGACISHARGLCPAKPIYLLHRGWVRQPRRARGQAQQRAEVRVGRVDGGLGPLGALADHDVLGGSGHQRGDGVGDDEQRQLAASGAVELGADEAAVAELGPAPAHLGEHAGEQPRRRPDGSGSWLGRRWQSNASIIAVLPSYLSEQTGLVTRSAIPF